MTQLEDFIKFQDVAQMETDVYINDRLGTFTVKPLSGAKNEEFRKRSLEKDGKTTNINKFQVLLVAEQTIKPELANADFLAQTGCQTAREFIERKLLSGEIAAIANKILEISGFDIDINKKVEEAKN